MKYAKIIWDGNLLELPNGWMPREDQMQGSNLDKLIEIAGRSCYDSCGTGRNSADYHKHILDVDHTSVLEHANLTFAVHMDIPSYLSCAESLLNRPGVFCCKEMPSVLTPQQGFIMRITANLRSILEWHEFPPANKFATELGNQMQLLAKSQAPLVFQTVNPARSIIPLQLAKPKYDKEIWLSVYIENVSRGFSHELVRHKFSTAVSQRSTRYVDEGDSKWCWHPLIVKNINPKEDLVKETKQVFFDDYEPAREETETYSLEEIQSLCQKGYKALVEKLQAQLINDGTDKFTARKQARGAARGMLGNALNTELLFSATVSQWAWIFKMRASAAADAEIRVVANEIYELFSERFPNLFKGYEKIECPDKIGYGLELKEQGV